MSMAIFQFANGQNFTAAASPGASQKRTAMPSAGRRNRSWTTATLHLRWLPGMARQRLRLSRAGRLQRAPATGKLQSMAVGDNALGRRTSWDLSNFWWDAEASSDVYFLYLFVCIVWSNCSPKQVLFFKHLVSTCLDRPFELILSRLSTKDRGTNMQRRYSIPCSLAKVFEGSKPISYVRWPNLSYIFIPSMNGMFTWLSNFEG